MPLLPTTPPQDLAAPGPATGAPPRHPRSPPTRRSGHDRVALPASSHARSDPPGAGRHRRHRSRLAAAVTVAHEGLLALSAAAELGAPAVCACCRTPGEPVCVSCRARVDGGWFDTGPRGVGRVGSPSGLVPILAAGTYDGALAAVLRAYKDGHRRDLADLLAPGLLAAALACVEAAPGAPGPGRHQRWVLVPAPSAKAADRRRGDNPTAALARLAARAADSRAGPCLDVVRLLGVGRQVADQAALSRVGRAANVDRAFVVRSQRLLSACSGARVVVVDDVATTGATARECVRALTAAGLPVAGVACALATPAPRPVGHR